jgi:hypothetical protein
MIDILAKTAVIASLAVFGVVVVIPPPPRPAPAVVALDPVAAVSKESLQPTMQAIQLAEHLRRLEVQAQIQETASARLSGKLDLLLEGEGVNATVRPRPKPER